MADATGAVAAPIFIGHARGDQAAAEAVCSGLEQAGLRCWIAPRNVTPGGNWGSDSLDAIRRAGAAVVLVSQQAIESERVQREVRRSAAHGVPIVAIRLDDTPTVGSVRDHTDGMEWIDAVDAPLHVRIPAIVAAVQAVAVAPPDPAARPAAPVHARSAVPLIIAIAAAAVLLVSGAVLWYGGVGQRGGSAPVIRAPAATAAATPPAANPNQAPPDPRAAFKDVALAQARWLTCSETFCSFVGLRSIFPAVTRIRLGETATELTRTLDVPAPNAPPEFWTAAVVLERYTLEHIPIRPGADEMYAQLEFYDGTRSDARPADMSGGDDRVVRGAALRPEGVRPGGDDPSLFAAFSPAADRLTFMPDAPPDTAEISYSINGGVHADALAFSGPNLGRVWRGFQFDSPLTVTTVDLKFTMADKTTLGPYRYVVSNLSAMIMEAQKANAAADPSAMIDCIRVEGPLPADPPAGASVAEKLAAQHRAQAARTLLASRNLSFVTDGPFTACVPTPARGSSDLNAWSAVRELKLGAAPGPMDTIPVRAEVSDALAHRWPSSSAAALWHVTLPSAPNALVFQLVFKDGTTTPPTRLVPENLNIR